MSTSSENGGRPDRHETDTPSGVAGPRDLALAARELHTTAMRKGRQSLVDCDGDVTNAANLYIVAFQSHGLLSGSECSQIETVGREILRGASYSRGTVHRVREVFEVLLDSSASPMAIMLAGGAVSSLELAAEGIVSPGVLSADWVGALGGGSVGATVGSAGGPYGTAAGAVLGGSIGLGAASIAAAIDDD